MKFIPGTQYLTGAPEKAELVSDPNSSQGASVNRQDVAKNEAGESAKGRAIKAPNTGNKTAAVNYQVIFLPIASVVVASLAGFATLKRFKNCKVRIQK